MSETGQHLPLHEYPTVQGQEAAVACTFVDADEPTFRYQSQAACPVPALPTAFAGKV